METEPSAPMDYRPADENGEVRPEQGRAGQADHRSSSQSGSRGTDFQDQLENALCRLAVRFRFVSQSDLEAAAAEIRGQGVPIQEELVRRGLLTRANLEMLSQIVAVGSSAGRSEVDPRSKPQIGARLGDFRILRQIGRGSMGVVYEAEQESLKRPVALKVLPSEFTRDERTIERFRREAGAAASLDHPGIVKVLFVGEENGFHFFAMDMVRGKSMDRIIDTERIPFRRAAEIVRDAAEALDYAHSRGVVHRDIKPGNVMVTREGRVLLADFGLARVDTTGTLTRMDEIVGTPVYMSPEQARGDRESVDARTDIYSLGASLYEALTLYPPFEGADVHQILSAVIGKDPRPPRSINPLIPRDLETICLKALEKDPGRRYQSAAAMACDLDRFLKGDPITARPPSWFERVSRKARRNRLAAGLVVFAVLLAAAASAFLVARRMQEIARIRLMASTAEDFRRRGEKAYMDKTKALQAVSEIESRVGQTQESREKSELMRSIRALQSTEDTEYESALEWYDRVLRIDPLNRDANTGIAWIYLHKALTDFHNEKRIGESYTGSFSKVRERVATIKRHDLSGRFSGESNAMIEYVERKGALRIESSPPGAGVWISRMHIENDAEIDPESYKGVTPAMCRDLEPGAWMVRVDDGKGSRFEFPAFLSRNRPQPVVDPIDLPIPGSIPAELAYVPGGDFIFGGRVPGAAPEEWKHLPAFLIGRKEVTFGEYLEFLNGSSEPWAMDPLVPSVFGFVFEFDYEKNMYVPPRNWEAMRDLPAWGIPFEGARQYCRWRSDNERRKALEKGAPAYLSFRLPTEVEWEKAARGPDGRRFPWGDSFDERRCNNEYGKRQAGLESAIDVGGSYPEGASPYGVHDMAGNVAEWTATFDRTGREVIVKGGDLYNDSLFLSCPARRQEPPKSPRVIGFRVLAEFRPVDGNR